MRNPLLESTHLPSFSEIQPEQVQSALDSILADNHARIQEIARTSSPTWETFVEPLEQLGDRLSNMWSTVSHLHAVMNTSAWRDVYQACLPKLTEYSTELGQHEGLYRGYQNIDVSVLNPAQKKVIENELRDFRLSGVHLSPEQKKRYGEIQHALSDLSMQFENNVMDATMGWHKDITDFTLLSGIPEAVLKNLETTEGWRLTLDAPCYDAVITYADSRELREEIYLAYTTRASNQGPQAGHWDNTAVITQILLLRQELAELLDFKNYAELSLETKMAKTPEKVKDFLLDLAKRVRPYAQTEWKELQKFAQMPDLQAWDIAYYSEKLMQQRYQIDEEKVRQYFPMNQVLTGLFQVVARLYNVQIHERKDVDIWHPDVRFFEIYDAHKNLRGQFYVDPYARPYKREGAWMDDCRQRWRLPDGQVQTPVAYLVCNFRPASVDDPALLSHDEVLTLFHEFGHGLQHLLTQIDYVSVSGINGVDWDAVELPSQFMENWCWQKPALEFLSSHYETGKPLPEEWLQNMLAAKHFHAGLHLSRQLLFSLFDIRLHSEKVAPQELLDELRRSLSVIPTPTYNRFQNSFTHVFSGGYAAGYYSYLWAEVLSCDAFSAFEEQGIFDAKTGQAFLQTILEQGGSREPLDLFIEFRGREPSIQAFLRHSGLD